MIIWLKKFDWTHVKSYPGKADSKFGKSISNNQSGAISLEEKKICKSKKMSNKSRIGSVHKIVNTNNTSMLLNLMPKGNEEAVIFTQCWSSRNWTTLVTNIKTTNEQHSEPPVSPPQVYPIHFYIM